MSRARLSKDGVLEKLDEFIAQSGNRKKAAGLIGCSYTYLSDVVEERRPPGPKILVALGIEKVYQVVKQ